jgi:hypothetical protein
MVVLEVVPIELSGNRGCYDREPASTEYMSDPCCNPRLQVSQCCPERTVTVNTTRLAFINYTRADESIPPGAYVTTEAGFTPSATRQLLADLAVRVLNQFAQAERIRADGEFGCDAALRRTALPNYLDDSIKFPTSRCSSNADCHTACSAQTRRCSPPQPRRHSGRLRLMLPRVGLDRMTPEVLLLVRDLVRVPAAPAATCCAGNGPGHGDALQRAGRVLGWGVYYQHQP